MLLINNEGISEVIYAKKRNKLKETTKVNTLDNIHTQILHFVSKLFVKYTIREKSVMRITRNADIDEADVYDEDLDYRDIMEHLIKQRTRLNPVRRELRLN